MTRTWLLLLPETLPLDTPSSFSLTTSRPLRSTLFPYTTLFRSFSSWPFAVSVFVLALPVLTTVPAAVLMKRATLFGIVRLGTRVSSSYKLTSFNDIDGVRPTDWVGHDKDPPSTSFTVPVFVTEP